MLQLRQIHHEPEYFVVCLHTVTINSVDARNVSRIMMMHGRDQAAHQTTARVDAVVTAQRSDGSSRSQNASAVAG